MSFVKTKLPTFSVLTTTIIIVSFLTGCGLPIDGDKKISEKHIGVDNVNLQDAAGCYAYHIPEGIILHYNPKKEINQLYNKDWKNISVLDFAPSLLNKFNKKLPSYMKNERLFNN